MSNLSRKAARSAFLALGLLGLLLLVAACGGAPTLASSSLANAQSNTHRNQPAYTFQTLDDQADRTFNQLLGINNDGKIAGYYGSGADAQHPNKGYTLSLPYQQGNYRNENFPGSIQTQVVAINNHGETAGFWIDGNNNNFGFVDWDNHFTSYSDPNTGTGTVNQLLGLNDEGIAVGFYTDGAGNNHGYELNVKTKKFTELMPPGGVSVSATGINNRGDVVGFYTDSNKNTFSFLYKDHHFTKFSYPGSNNTQALGINNEDQIVGSYADSANKTHGFLASQIGNHAHFQSIDDPNGIGSTTINGLNDRGELVGFYVDGAGLTDGFLAKPRH